MADFNQILTPGDVDGGIINVVNEIPAGSNHKIEWNRKLAAFQLDRIEPAIFAKPTNYGFIPQLWTKTAMNWTCCSLPNNLWQPAYSWKRALSA
ncbi:inorganic pyrophosphatase [Neisseria gonorrhoeae]|uniref:inorganic diphosphatase n=1 Tax=Neisseria gonorrhoeae TaxID=485 RepID=A0A378VZA3_NEIGO|nr:inorganic pyrophosphatase [Neisseria gonorrhoeae]